MKLAKTRVDLMKDPKMAWANDFTPGQIKLIGLAEVLGALGLVLPLALGILPILTPAAALGLAILLFGASATHIRRKESPTPAVILSLLSLLVAVGRFYF